METAPVENTDPQRRRRKCKKRVQKWVRNRVVFKTAISLAITLYKRWRLWDEIVKRFGG